MTYFNKKAAFALSMLTAGVMGVTQQAYANSISSIQTLNPAQNITQLRIGFDEAVITPTAYQQSGSNQLVLDFNNVNTSIAKNTVLNDGVVNSITALQGGNTTRLLVDLAGAANYDSRVEGNQLVVDIFHLGNHTAINKTVAQPSVIVNPLLVPTNAQNTMQDYSAVSSINYSGNAQGGGSVSIVLANEAIPVDVQRQGGKIIVRMTGSNIPKHLLKRLNAGGLVSSIDVQNQGRSGVITINVSDDYEYQAYQSGTQLKINVRPATPLAEPTLEERVYEGEPLSMEFEDVPVRTVLDVLAKFTDLNIVAGDSVQGNITLRLMNVPWDQALDIILTSRNLDKRRNNNVVIVAPAAELAQQEADALKAQQEVKELAPLRTEYIRLNYAKAPDVLALILESRNAGSVDDSTHSTGLLSSRGSVSMDQRTNTLIVKDTTESIKNIHAMIEKIDISVKQVMVEARIVSATNGFDKQLGVKWGLIHDTKMRNSRFQAGGSENTLQNLRASNDGVLSISPAKSNMTVNLGASSPVGSIAFGLLNVANSILDLELSAMQADNKGEIISSPKVLTADKQTARISSGYQLAFQESAGNGATATAFVEAALTLEVTPNITPDGKIGLDLNITNGTPTVINGATAISEESVETNIILEDGQTVVLGGVFFNNVSNNQTDRKSVV